MDIELNDTFIGIHYRKSVKWKIEMISHGIVYYLEQNTPEEHRILQKMKTSKFELLIKNKFTRRIRSGKTVDISK